MTAVIVIALALLSTTLVTQSGARSTTATATAHPSGMPRLVSGGGGFADAPLLGAALRDRFERIAWEE